MQFLTTPYPIGYQDALRKMEIFVSEIQNDQSDEIVWFLEHPSMYTLGKMSKKSDIKSIPTIPVIETDRGGKTTYHGPGQLIVYFMCNLQNYGNDIKFFVNALENIIINSLWYYKIIGERGPKPGVWVKDAKIASIGLQVKKSITLHGISININPDLKYFRDIYTCGMDNALITSLASLGADTDRGELEEIFTAETLKILGQYRDNSALRKKTKNP